jgi:uncharacterized DUF497 family protein
MHYHFEWDPNKVALNISSHKISFSRAATIFKDPFMLTIFDEEHTDTEERWVTMGHDEHDIVLVVCHTFQSIDQDHCIIRIISARKATKRERKQYGASHETRI